MIQRVKNAKKVATAGGISGLQKRFKVRESTLVSTQVNEEFIVPISVADIHLRHEQVSCGEIIKKNDLPSAQSSHSFFFFPKSYHLPTFSMMPSTLSNS